jgi:maltose O-acetyltransferase
MLKNVPRAIASVQAIEAAYPSLNQDDEITRSLPMRTEKQKMLAGELYTSNDAELSAERLRAKELCHAINALDPSEIGHMRDLMALLFHAQTDVNINPPFFCDYGYNIKLGSNVYLNINCIILDVSPVSIGHNTLLGPAVQIYTASHPMNAMDRRTGLEFGKPIDIGEDVWIGGSAILCPGVSIGARSVIGAGSVVTRSIPPDVFAAGNPCRAIRPA